MQQDKLDCTGHKVRDYPPNIMAALHPTSIDIKVPDLIPLAWQCEAVIWVDQWPILEPRLFVSKELVLEQLSLGHLESLRSIHNTLYNNNNKYFLSFRRNEGNIGFSRI